MSSSVTPNKMVSNLAVKMYKQAPGDTSADYVGWIDMSGYENILVGVMESVLTGLGVTAFSLYAATDTSATSATLIRSHALGTAPHAAGDQVYLEATAEEIAGLGVSGLR